MWALGPVLTAGVNASFDPHYDKVVLLLRATGANASKAVVDESPHGHTVVAAGDAAVSTAQSVNGGTSYVLDGSGDYLFTAYSAACFDFPAGTDFTIEMWFYPTGDITDRTLISCYQNATTGWSLSLDSSSKPYFNCAGDGVGVQGSVPVVINRWYHIAVCREGTSLRMYLNGELIGLAVDGSNLSSGASDLFVGRLSASFTTYDWQGYVDDVRITKGVARYGLPTVAPAAAELTAGDATLLNFDGTDGATSATDLAGKTWTFYGNAQLDTAQSRYGSASLLLDGSGDYLQREASSGLPAANSNYTISMWLRTTAALHDAGLISWGNWGTANQVTGLALKVDGTVSHFWWSNDLSGTISLNDGLWHHVMASFDGTVRKIWVDGRVIAADKPTSHNVTNETQAVIGRSSTTLTDYFNGWLDDVRVTSSVLSIKAFDPTAIGYFNQEKFWKADTARLTCDADALGVYDSTGRRWLLVGNAAMSTTQSRTSGHSLYFDGGASTYAYAPSSPDFDLGDVYTVECWAYPTSTASNFGIIGRGKYESDSTWTGMTFSVRWLNTGVLRVYFWATTNVNEQYVDIADGVVANAWTHIAVVRNGAVGYVFINGILRGVKTALSSNAVSNQPVVLGFWNNYNGAEKMTGYIDGVRLTKGAARYLPLTPTGRPNLTSYSDLTVCNFEGTNGATTYTDETGRRWTFNGNAQLSTAQVKFGTTSLALGGTGDYLTSPDYSSFAFGTGDFSVDWWMYKSANGSANYDTVIDTSGNVNATGGWFIEASSTRGIVLCREGVVRVQYNASPNDSTWHHCCVMRRNGQLYILLDGVQVATAADSATYAAAQMNIGRNGSNTYFFNGYIDGLRVTKGIPRFVDYRPGPYASWHVSYDPHKDSVSSHVRGNGPNTGTTITDDTGKVWTNNAVTTSTTQSRFRGSSLYFNGTTSYMNITNGVFVTGTSDFTWEAWVYSNTTGAWTRLVETSPYNSATKGWHLSFNGTDSSGSRRLGLQLANSGGGGARLDSDLAFPNARWSHVAVVRENNVGRLFIDGFPQSTTIDLSAQNFTVDFGRYGAVADTPGNYFTGYMADVRMTKGVARYTPTMYMTAEPAVADSFDVAVLNFNGTDGSTDITDLVAGNSWTCGGNTQLATAQKKFGSASLYFDGAGGYLTIPTASKFDLSVFDFTIEAWVYITSLAAARAIASRRYDANAGWCWVVGTSGQVYLRLVIGGSWNDGYLTTANGVITANNWHHVSLNRRGSTLFMAVDGVIRSRVTNTGAIEDQAQPVRLGVAAVNTNETPFQGYMDSFRMTVGRCRYGPPMAPLPRWKK